MTVEQPDAPSFRTMRKRPGEPAVLLLIVAATLLAYLPSLWAGWVWDDDHYVTGNIHLHTLHGLRELWLRPGAVPQYYPLTHTTFWIEYHLWGLRPFGYHLDNVLLHIVNALLVWRILRRLGVPGCWLAGIIFTLHPVEVESVAWVTERKNVLSGAMYLSAMWVGLEVWGIAPRRWATRIAASISSSPGTLGEGGGEGLGFELQENSGMQQSKDPHPSPLPAYRERGQEGAVARYLICLVLFALALLSKSVTASFPAIILLLIWWKRGRVTWRDAASLAPFFALGAAIGSITSWMEMHVVGATGPDWNFTWVQRVLIASHAVWFYLGKIVWPHPLSFVYARWKIDVANWMMWLWVALWAVLLVGWLAQRKRTTGAMVAGLFFLITLIPALGFINVYPMRYSFVADHFQYLASIGPIALVAYLLHRWRTVAMVLLVVLGFSTFQQCRIYADAETLWRDVVAKDPDSPIGLTDLAVILQSHGDLPAAKELFIRALAVRPDWTEAALGLGSVAEARGKFDEAMADYVQAAQTKPNDPRPPAEMGRLYRRLNDFDKAANQFDRASRLAPSPAPVYWEWGEMEMSQGRLPEAAGHFKQALAADPDFVSAYNDLAAIDLTRGDLPDAQTQCANALAINPDDLTANNNMGATLARQGRPVEAAEYFRRALEIDPGYMSAKENLQRLAHQPL